MNLEDVDWENLRHAYGEASNIPDLLRSLDVEDVTEPIRPLWNALCHQGTIYTASVAALPFLVAQAENAQSNAVALNNVLALAGAIALAGMRRQGIPRVSATLLVDYNKAIVKLTPLILRNLPNCSDDYTMGHLGVLAALHGKPEIGIMLFDASEEMECPNCDANFPRFYDLDDSYSFADQQDEDE